MTPTDLVERQRAEAALRTSEERFRRYFELGLIGMAMTSPSKGVVEVNNELCRILGYPREELQGKTWAEMTHPEDLPADVRQFDRVIAGEIDGYTLDKRFIRKDGRVIDTIMAAQCVRRPDGAADYFFGLVLDTTERKRAEAGLQKLQAELTHVARVATLGELAASIAHEINQPLGAIVNNANACLRLAAASGTGHEMREALADIVSDAKRASAIIARVRDMTWRTLPEKTSLRLRDVVADVVALARGELTKHRIEMRTELPADLPNVSGDGVQLRQVLLNLLMNAIDATLAGEDARRILTIRAQRSALEGKPLVLLTIQDFGPGFRPEDAERIFEAFFTTKPRGLGMGLRISRSIVEAHGGRLGAAPNDDAPGTTFSCVLPAES